MNFECWAVGTWAARSWVVGSWCPGPETTGSGWVGAWTYTRRVSEEDEEIALLWREWTNYYG